MYSSIYYDSKSETVHLWDDKTGYEKFPFEPYAYIINKNGEHVTIDGHRCSKVSKWSPEATKLNMVFESNVAVTTRTLIDRYPDSDELSENVKVLFLDIEVAKETKYSTVKAAANKITSISYHLTGDDKYTCLLLNEKKGKQTFERRIEIKDSKDNSIFVDADIVTFSSEFDLLRYFVSIYQKFGHSIITGWNVEYFDMPYMFNRLVNVMGYSWAIQLSPIKIVKKKNYNDEKNDAIIIAGISVLDYLMLYRKFTYTEQPNYKLNTIAQIELKYGKVDYEGDLDYLYATDIAKFAEYNIVDVVIVVELNKKLDYIDIARGLCHEGHVPYEDVIYSSRYIEGAILTHCRRKNLIVSANKSNFEGQAAGAYVKLPKPGLYKWVYDLDLVSLYPMTMITLNISPETKFGKVVDWDETEYAKGTTKKYNINLFKDNTSTGQFDDIFQVKPKAGTDSVKGSEELLEYLKKNNLSIASNGVMYTLDNQGILPEILDKWFKQRDEAKNIRKKHETEGNKDLASYYNKKQLVKKYQLNTVYGYLLLPSSKFYDKENGEAVTVTGVSIIKWSGSMANHLYNKRLGTDEDYVIYCDTDSEFLPLLPLLEKDHPNIVDMTDDEISELGLPVINEVQGFINKSFDKYGVKLHNVIKHRWNIKQELISRRSFWVTSKANDVGVKKRYAQWLVNKEGHPVNEIDIKGLEAIRSNFPKLFRQVIKDVLHDILHDVGPTEISAKVRDFKKQIDNAPIVDIMSPTGVKDITKWGNGISKTPVHVRSALNYNTLLKLNNIENITPILDGDKIIWGYLKQNPYNFKSIALKVFEDVESPEIFEFVSNNIDRNAIFEKLLIGKVQQYWDSLNWGTVEMNTLSRKFF